MGYIGEAWMQQGLVAGYHMNGNSQDFSGNGNHGSDTAMSYAVANGKIAQGAIGNGTTGFILLPSLTLGSTYTFISWCYFTDNTVARYADCIWNADVQRYTAAGSNQFKITYFGLVGNAVPALNQWHQIAAIRNGANSYLYINGVLDHSGAAAVNMDGQKRILGRMDVSDNTTYRFKGNMDEVGIYNVAKDATWIKKMYAYSKGKFI